MVQAILDVDLLAFERGSEATRRAVVDGVKRSLQTGFVYTSSDLSADLLDTAYGMLREFFALDPANKQRFVAPGAGGQTGYTGLLVETAAGSEQFAIPNPDHVAQPLIQLIVDDLLGRGTCPSTGESARRTSAVMDHVLEGYYGGRTDAFWLRPATWPGRSSTHAQQ